MHHLPGYSPPDSSASALGYPDADPVGRWLLVLSHLLLIPSIRLAWPARNHFPELVVAFVACFVASSTYHACYSLDACYFDDKRVHRHLDHIFSGMLFPVLCGTFLWDVRQVPRCAHPSHATRTSVWVHETSAAELVVHVARRPGGSAGAAAAAAGNQCLAHVRPTILGPLYAAAYLAMAATHLHNGIDRYRSTIVLAAGVAAVVAAHVAGVVALAPAGGVRVEWRLLGGLLLLLAVALSTFTLDDTLGAWGHDAWHALVFGGMYAYLRLGPIVSSAHGVRLCLA